MLYRAVVKKKVRDTFAELSNGNSRALVDQLADPFIYTFEGDHALGGRRNSVSSMESWFSRLGRIFDRLEFDPIAIEVGGAPWNTTVLTEVAVTGTVAGEPYSNVLFQRIRLSMGRITEIRTLEDTQRLVAALDRAASAGKVDATAAPIVDD